MEVVTLIYLFLALVFVCFFLAYLALTPGGDEAQFIAVCLIVGMFSCFVAAGVQLYHDGERSGRAAVAAPAQTSADPGERYFVVDGNVIFAPRTLDGGSK